MKSSKSSKQSYKNRLQFDQNSKQTNEQISSVGTTDRMQQINIEELQEFNLANYNFIREQLKFLMDQNQKQQKENQQLRILNYDYAQKLNNLAHQKPVGVEKIVLTSDMFESQAISSKVKDYVRKLANNYKIQEREQTRLIAQCDLLENDLKTQKELLNSEQKKNDDLSKKYQKDTDQLLLKIKSFEERNLQLQQQLSDKIEENKQLQLKIESNEESYRQQQIEYNNLEKLHQDLQQKYTTLFQDYSENALEKKQKLSMLKHHCDELEYQLRNLQHKSQEIKNEKLLQDIKVLELEQINQTLQTNTGTGFGNKYQSTTHKSSQSPVKITFK